MKNLICLIFVTLLWSCHYDDKQFQIVDVGVPVLLSKAEYRALVKIEPPQPIMESGKIYAYNNYIFVSDKFLGVHVIDNTDPSSPQPLAFIKIPGNEDLAVKDNFLYADSSIDLMVFNISNISNIQQVETLEDVFYTYDYQFPPNIWNLDMSNYNSDTHIIVGWDIKKRKIEINDDIFPYETLDSFTNGSIQNSVGIGGSLARFQIVDNYLYTVGTYEMNIFNIENLSQPTQENSQNVGWNIETMFFSDGHLYLGSTNGMYIYSLSNASSPEFVSQFVHWTGCDPVVVDGDYAYLTLRGGNLCGQNESILEVIDISNKSNPTSVAIYVLDNPYGLGYMQNNLYVCDGTSGLKVFDKSNPLELQLVDTFSNIQAEDVIPLNGKLILIGNNMLYQYEYINNTLQLLSTYSL